jgi:hypothetical protein
LSAPAKRGAAPAPATAEVDVGERVIALRSEGHTYAAIAEEIGLERKIEAFSIFADAVTRRSPAEQTELRAQENVRLDALEQRAQQCVDLDERGRRLASIEKLRQRLAGP